MNFTTFTQKNRSSLTDAQEARLRIMHREGYLTRLKLVDGHVCGTYKLFEEVCIDTRVGKCTQWSFNVDRGGFLHVGSRREFKARKVPAVHA